MKYLGFIPQILDQGRWQDVVDILLVYIIVYRILLLIRGTRAVQILTGMGLIGLTYFLSDRLGLFVLNFMLKQFFEYLFIIMIVLFQDEIRRALANIGRNPFLSGSSTKSKAAQVLEEVCKTAGILAAKRIGALIALERQHGLKNYTEGATHLEAEVSAELLVSIFHVNSPIHDGAVIIRGGKVLAAGCFVPVTLQAEIDRNLGTRHRAALGLTEETDAVVVVMSEERGEISLVEFGEITRALTIADLRDRLYRAFDLEDELIRHNVTGPTAANAPVEGASYGAD